MDRRKTLYGERPKRSWPWWLGSIVLVAAIAFAWLQLGPGIWSRTTVDGALAWEGGNCLVLERWTGFGWERVGSAPIGDARAGRWDTAAAAPGCPPPAEVDATISLPEGVAAGTYRVCDLTGRCKIVRHTS